MQFDNTPKRRFGNIGIKECLNITPQKDICCLFVILKKWKS